MDNGHDFELKELIIESVNGGDVDVSLLMSELNIYEDIFNTTVSGDMVLDDTNNEIKNLPITGHEWIRIKFRRPDRGFIQLRLRIYKVSARELEKERRQLFILHFVANEEFLNAQKRISKAYKNLTISDIVENIQKEYLDSSFYKLEKTKNLHHIIPGNWSPFRTVNFMASRANSGTHKGANYVYYQSTKGWNFVSIEELVSQDPQQKYLYEPANVRDQEVETGYKPRTLDRDTEAIQAYRYVSNFDTLENTSNGMYGSSLIWHDIHTKDFGIEKFDYVGSYLKYKHVENNTVSGGQSRLWTSASDFKGDMAQLKSVSLGQKESQNHVKEWLLPRLSQMQQIQNIRLFVTIPGDSNRKCGDIVTLDLPSPEPLVENQLQMDSYYTGKFLVSGVRHIITKQKYSTIMEVLKDSVATSYP